MSLQWQISRTMPADTSELGQILFRPTNPYRQIGDHFGELFPDEVVFAPLYDTTGRGAIPPLLLALVTMFQMWEKAADRVAAECVVSRMDWKYALHLPLTYTGFHFTDLCAFRQRLLAHNAERLLFDGLVAQLTKLGYIPKRGKMRTDSSHIIAVVERLGRLELVTECIRLALDAVDLLVPQWVADNVPASFQDTYAQRLTTYGLSETAIGQKLIRAGQDGFWFLTQWDRAVPVAPDHVPEAVTTLRTVLQQQFPTGDGAAPRPKRPSGRNVIESPHEPEARLATKRRTSWQGYKVQVTESCDDDRPHLLTDMDVTDADANDSPELPAIQGRLLDRGLVPVEHFVDAGYMSGRNLATSVAAGIALLGKPLADTSGPPGFRQTDFQIDESARQATCPAGQHSTHWQEEPAPVGGDPAVTIRFTHQTCRSCRFFGICTTSKRGRWLHLHPYRRVLATRRAEAMTDAFLEKLHRRAGVEGTISELVRAHGMRYARYRGKAKVRLQGLYTAAAVNVKRLLRWWAEPHVQTALVVPS